MALSDSSSLQDVFLDPSSSQDSTHKLDSGKDLAYSEETVTPVKDTTSTVEEAGIYTLWWVWFLYCLGGETRTSVTIWCLYDLLLVVLMKSFGEQL